MRLLTEPLVAIGAIERPFVRMCTLVLSQSRFLLKATTANITARFGFLFARSTWSMMVLLLMMVMVMLLLLLLLLLDYDHGVFGEQVRCGEAERSERNGWTLKSS